eukprot:TRINITY_DN11371_c0_g3_i1.p1 TRINITY_DN11371_c0_g3~~TRINITY_DN11371_c0_g3_i1.p1  ORF type:complete len:406 (+),score=34.76 TRINITY_DN11371_c0_g3_i1:95-1219(+)
MESTPINAPNTDNSDYCSNDNTNKEAFSSVRKVVVDYYKKAFKSSSIAADKEVSRGNKVTAHTSGNTACHNVRNTAYFRERLKSFGTHKNIKKFRNNSSNITEREANFNSPIKEFDTCVNSSSFVEGVSSIHSLYQNVIIADNKKEIASLEDAIRSLQEKATKLRIENLQLKEQNKKLRILLGRYKEYVTSSRVSTHYTEEAKTLSRHQKLHSLGPSDHGEPSNTTERMKENVHLDLLAGAVAKISKASSVRALIDVLYHELGILIKSCNTGIFIVDKNLNKLYQGEKGLSRPLIAGECIIDLALENTISHAAKPAFNSLKEMRRVMKNNKSISLPVVSMRSKDNILLVLQIDNNSSKQVDKNIYEQEQWVVVH